MINAEGSEVTDKLPLANVFAQFYEDLYSSTGNAACSHGHVCKLQPTETPFTREELRLALSKMKAGKAKDASGIIAEMLKEASEPLLNAILDVFNDVFYFRSEVPAAWRKTKLVVIFKKGDPKLASNYRPIAILPVLYKLFSRMLCDRMVPFVMRQQSTDQAAYRKGYSTEDHLLAVSLLVEKSKEYNVPVWCALVDFEKAFDSVEHDALLEVLGRQNVPAHYVDLVARLYEKQTAYVQCSCVSREFVISRGVKQGDPISALLFIAVMQDLLDGLEQRWKRTNRRKQLEPLGLDVGADRYLTNLRFADDVVLVARSKADITKMLAQFGEASKRYGLKLHFGKTKLLTWDALADGCESVSIGGVPVVIQAETAAEKYLGRKLCFGNSCEVELNNRIASAWAAFHVHKNELCGKNYRMVDRLRLFEAVVSPVMLYGCSAWALTKKMEDRIIITWRRMLRYVLCLHRRRSEEWVDYMQRSTAELETLTSKLGADDWVAAYRMKKFRFACRVANQAGDRWSKVLMQWAPAGKRDPGRPLTRWCDDLNAFAGDTWQISASDPQWCEFAVENFAKWPK